MSKYCGGCYYWLYAYESHDEKIGTCDHSLVEAKVLLEKEYDGEIVIHTEQYFGCIYFTPKHGNVVTRIDVDDL